MLTMRRQRCSFVRYAGVNRHLTIFLYICKASSSSVSTPISLSIISPYWFITRYVGMASCCDGWMKSSLSVNSLFNAPGKRTLMFALAKMYCAF
jgi:hypothetical protein